MLPGGVFDRGFIRTYAKRLGLDAEDKVSEYTALTANQRIREPAQAYDTSELPTRSTADSGTLKPAPTDDASGSDTRSTDEAGTPEPAPTDDASGSDTRSAADSGTPEPAPTDDARDFHPQFTDEAGTPELRTLTDLSIATLRMQPPRQTPRQTHRQTRREDTRGGLVGRIWDYEFSHAEQSVLQARADHAKDDGSDCVPGLRRVAYKARMFRTPCAPYLERPRKAPHPSVGVRRQWPWERRAVSDLPGQRKAPSEFRDVAQISTTKTIGQGRATAS